MTILVTGATGYVGREFIKAYQNSYEIIALVRKSSNTNQLVMLNCIVKEFDSFTDIHNVFKEKDINGIIHFASSVIIMHNYNDIDILIDSNIRYGVYLLELSKKFHINWFINTGTFWQNYQNESYNPVNLYAATKEAFENIAKYYTETSNLIFSTIKLNDIFGANDTRVKIFNLWNTCSKSGELLDMSEGEQIIDISFIEDVISAFGCMIENLQRVNNNEYNNKSYAVVSNQRMTLKELAKVFELVTQRKLNINWGSRAYRYREVMMPPENIEKVPNWKQKYSLEQAIIKTMGK